MLGWVPLTLQPSTTATSALAARLPYAAYSIPPVSPAARSADTRASVMQVLLAIRNQSML